MMIWMIWLLHAMYSTATSPTFRRFAWGTAGGSITGFQNFLKDSLTIVKALKNEANVPYFLLGFLAGMAVLTAFTGLILLMLCMKRYDATYSAAMFVGSFCIAASIMSAIHYDTFTHLDGTLNYIGYPAGLVTLLFGVYLLLKAGNDTLAISTNTEAISAAADSIEEEALYVETPVSNSCQVTFNLRSCRTTSPYVYLQFNYRLAYLCFVPL
jgi:hypothetical protein